MAGAGYKLFNTGDVLTAAQVNTYLQEQTVMVFANSTARTTALSGVLAEGMMSYLQDTNAVQVYNGTSWVSVGGSSPLTTKGDLYTYSTADARLAVGSNGETLVADSSATTGLRWQGNFAAGKNKIINGDFNIWQRGTSFTTNGYTCDRFNTSATGGTNTFSRQAFTAGAAPVAGYESQYFLRIATSGTATYFDISQPIEDVRTLAGQTITFSFWAKASSSVGVIALARQFFGSGGSANVDHSSSTITLTTSWTRYSFTTTLGSLSGKTIGTGSALNMFLYYTSGTVTSNNIDTWGWQVEAGNTATAFQTATGTLAGEFAAACRYYQQFGGGMSGAWDNTTTAVLFAQYPVTMRVAPTVALLTTTPQLGVQGGTDLTGSGSAIAFSSIGTKGFRVGINGFTGATQYRGNWVTTQSTDILSASAEL